MKSIAIPKVIGHQRVNRCKHSFWSPTEPDFQKVCTCATTMFSHIFSVFLKSGLPKSIHPFMIFHGFSVSPWFSWVFPIDVSAFMIQIPRPRSGVAWRPRACCPRLLQVPLRQMLVMFWSLAGHNDVNIILISYYTYIYIFYWLWLNSTTSLSFSTGIFVYISTWSNYTIHVHWLCFQKQIE